MNVKKLLMASAVSLALAGTAVAADQPVGQKLDDAQREGRIYASYALNRHLNPFEFKVTVNGNKAILNGTVEDAIDKDLAEQIALGVSGIQSVDNQIKVDSKVQPKARPAGERGFGTVVEDATITASVKSKLLWNEHTDGLDIHVSTRDGLVTLTGNADTAASKDLAAYLANNTEGVRDVDNKLVVAAKASTASATAVEARDKATAKAGTAGEVISDAWVTAKVKSSLLYSKHVAANDINVATENGVVTLKGKVDSSSEKALAVELAKNVRGVKKVDAAALSIRS